MVKFHKSSILVIDIYWRIFLYSDTLSFTFKILSFPAGNITHLIPRNGHWAETGHNFFVNGIATPKLPVNIIQIIINVLK